MTETREPLHRHAAPSRNRKRRRLCANSGPSVSSSGVDCSGGSFLRHDDTANSDREGEKFSSLICSISTRRREGRGHSSGSGVVVDLTYDSGVEDEEELVDLTSPVWVPVVDSSMMTRSSCSHDTNPLVSSSSSSSSSSRKKRREVVVVNESDDDIQIMDPLQRSPSHSSLPSCSETPSQYLSKATHPRAPTKNFVRCPICMETVSTFEQRGCQVVSTNCGHIFCSACLRRTVTELHKCPTCRKRLTLKQFHTLYL